MGKHAREMTAAYKTERQAPASEENRSRSQSNARNTKDWCRGKEGTPHTLKVDTYSNLKKCWSGRVTFHGWLIQFCSTCGKELETYIPPFRFTASNTKPIPEWARDFFLTNPKEKPENVKT
jgi:hypothetical protein